MKLEEFFIAMNTGNKVIHLQGAKGRWYQDHMLDLITAYKDELIDTIDETETDVYITLVNRKELEDGYSA